MTAEPTQPPSRCWQRHRMLCIALLMRGAACTRLRPWPAEEKHDRFYINPKHDAQPSCALAHGHLARAGQATATGDDSARVKRWPA